MRIFKIIIVVFSIFFFCFTEAKADGGKSLYVRTNKSYVTPGSSYELVVLSSRRPFVGYNGYLEVNVKSCDLSNSCSTKINDWGNYLVKDGRVRVDIPSNFPPSYFIARFRPKGSDWDWSNEIRIDVGTTLSLEDSKEYWIFDQGPMLFSGFNFVDKKSFKTVIGFMPLQTLCGETTRTMYVMKNDKSGYWDPHFPWMDPIRAANYDKNNLLWHIVPWQKKSDWDDEYLTALGDERFAYNESDPLNLQANFKEKKGQYRYEFPNYILSARWVGNGWGLGIKSKLTSASPNTPFCSINVPDSTTTGSWVVHTDIVNLETPKYKGPALRYKFYEGTNNFTSNSQSLGLREDWYFVKGKGLVEIEVKDFGPSSGLRKPCQEDDDCLINEIMKSPHLRLIRSDFSFSFSDLNSDGKVDIFDYNILVSNFGKTGNPGFIPSDINKDGRVDIFDYNILVGDFGKRF